MNEFLLTGEIDETNTTEAINFLEANEGDVVLNIDSIGGDVFAGLRLCQAIQKHKGKVIAKCGVVVASIASVIALSCDEMEITKDTFFMVHQAWANAQGTAKELLATATLLEQASSRIKEIIINKAVKAEDVEGWMGNDTWFGYQEMLDSFNGVSLVEEENKLDSKVIASYAKLKNKPEALVALVAKLQEEEEKPEEDKPQDEEKPEEDEEPSEEEKQEAEAKAKAEAYVADVLARAEAVLNC